MHVCEENINSESEPQIFILSQHPVYALELFTLISILLFSIEPNRKEQQMCETVLVLSTVYHLQSSLFTRLLKTHTGLMANLSLCAFIQSFYEQGNLPYPFSVLINNKDK